MTDNIYIKQTEEYKILVEELKKVRDSDSMSTRFIPTPLCEEAASYIIELGYKKTIKFNTVFNDKHRQDIFDKMQAEKLCPICGKKWHEDNEECGNEV